MTQLRNKLNLLINQFLNWELPAGIGLLVLLALFLLGCLIDGMIPVGR